MRDVSEVLATGQPDARQLLAPAGSALGAVQVTTAGYLVDGEAFAPQGGLSSLGSDTRAVLQAFGISDAEIEDLAAAGAIGVNN